MKPILKPTTCHRYPKCLALVAQAFDQISCTCGHDRARPQHKVGPSAKPTILLYDGFQSPAAGPASGRVSPESHDAIATIRAWS